MPTLQQLVLALQFERIFTSRSTVHLQCIKVPLRTVSYKTTMKKLSKSIALVQSSFGTHTTVLPMPSLAKLANSSVPTACVHYDTRLLPKSPNSPRELSHMPLIYHETQEAGLCGVHCLNSLLQGPYFTAVDLMTIARELDEKEREVMAQMGTETTEYLKFLAEDSGNVADDGNYSVQVLAEALKVWNLACVPYNTEEGKAARQNPTKEDGFICNLASHWLAIRKIEGEWYNLNSLLKEPQYLSPLYLETFLETLRAEGYSIFVVRGTFPQAAAARSLPSGGAGRFVRVAAPSRGLPPAEDAELEAAIRASLMDGPRPLPAQEDDQDPELLAAIQLSLQATQPPTPAAPLSPEPASGPGVVALSIRLPSGQRVMRRFRTAGRLSDVWAFVGQAMQLPRPELSHVLFAAMPYKEYGPPEATLEQLGLVSSAVLSVKQK